MGVVAMCPVAGGMLATESSMLKDSLGVDLPTSQMALRFVLSNPDVSSVCSGMSTMEMLEENIETVKNFNPDKDANFEEMSEGLHLMESALGDKFCTWCSYCMPCPEKIMIPDLMYLYTSWQAFGLEEGVRNAMAVFPEKENLRNCTECRKCEQACPNQISICDKMKKMTEMLN